ncbi:MAG: high-potential iron sulfur protein 2 [Gammaproteobacteria bacterium]|nr:high-potential iron sulfur protein 2 [Gammaproteobacteria bacterium]
MMKTRRTLLHAFGAVAITLPTSGLILSRIAFAADMPKLSIDDPTAKSLDYTHESADASKRCAGCQFYTGASDSAWGACVIFPEKLVSAEGLCNSWFMRAG